MLGVAGCEVSLQSDITPEFGQHQLVVNAILNTDSVFTARVTINKPILEDVPFENVQNATITISDEFGFSETLYHKSNGLYVSVSSKPEPGKTYSIVVTAPGLETARATSSIPKPVAITNMEFGQATFNDGILSTSIGITLSFQDPPDEENFYEVMVASGEQYYDSLLQSNVRAFYDVGVNSINSNNDYITAVGTRLLLKDALINGKEAKLLLTSPTIASYGNLSAVVLRSVSKQYYDYMITSELHLDVKNNPLAQPVNVLNNIENGFGIFAGYSNSAKIIERQFPVITSFSPQEGRPGDVVTILGENFIPGATMVTFASNGSTGINPAEIVEISATHVKVIVPNDAGTGVIILHGVGRTAFTSTVFTVLN